MKYLPQTRHSSLVTIGILVSLAPSLLPRPPIMQGIVTGLLAALAFAIAALVHRVARRVRGDTVRTPRESVQVLSLLVGAIAVSWAVIYADHWQDGLRRAMGMTDVGPTHWATVLASAILSFVVLVGTGTGLGHLARRVGRLGTVTAAVIAVVGAQVVVGPATWNALSQSYSESNATIDVAVDRPMSGALAGSPDSAIGWETLGREGRSFVAGGENAPGIRTYVGLNSATDTDTRAALAVSELDRAGGFERSTVVVAVPTGSGWIDSHAADGIEERFQGDVAIVGMQYSFAPSWVTFLFGRDAANDSAGALLTAIESHVSAMPAAQRPDIYVYGQSLGSVGGSAALRDSRTVCGALWAGPPAGSVNTDGATVLANTSDPVVWWSPNLVTNKPNLNLAERDAPMPTWIPGISFVQTSVDLLTALSVPPGHGHRYGTEQGTALPECGNQAGNAMGPRAASYAAPTR